jgi:hypothetical protein
MDVIDPLASSGFSHEQRERFVHDGFLRIDNAFSSAVASEARTILWSKTGCDPRYPATWTHPVVRIGDCAHPVFQAAANTLVLHRMFDELVGPKRWFPRRSLGSFPVRFPSKEDPGDTGWHIDASFAPDGQVSSHFDWRINLQSKGRALLMLFLFSDVGEEDAPTRIRIGSHIRIPSLLAPHGEQGMSFLELGEAAAVATEGMPESLALGAAGTVYLCHPFLVHAAQPHRGFTPRFMAQPPLYPREPLELDRNDNSYSPVEEAIRLGLGEYRQ